MVERRTEHVAGELVRLSGDVHQYGRGARLRLVDLAEAQPRLNLFEIVFVKIWSFVSRGDYSSPCAGGPPTPGAGVTVPGAEPGLRGFGWLAATCAGRFAAFAFGRG